MIGLRYGWVPLEYNVPDDQPHLDWLKTVPTGKSITHLEMYSGFLRNPANSRAVFCFRSEEFVREVPIDYQADFLSENGEYSRKLESLKQEIRDKCPQQFVLDNYHCAWRGVVDGKPMIGDLEQFGKHVLEAMWNRI